MKRPSPPQCSLPEAGMAAPVSRSARLLHPTGMPGMHRPVSLRTPSDLRWRAAGLAIAIFCCSDCSEDRRPDTQWGSAFLTWTINRESPSVSCSTLSASRFVALLAVRGELVERFEAPCGSLELDTGMLVAGDDYVLSASLLDDRGVPKAEEVASSPFSVKAGAVTRIDINFGADAWIDVDTDTDASPAIQ